MNSAGSSNATEPRRRVDRREAAGGSHGRSTFGAQRVRTTWYSLFHAEPRVRGWTTDGGRRAVGEAHAVAIEVARGTDGFRAECGKQMDVIRGGSWPPSETDVGGRCPAFSRLTGA
jgi:hypothetical protein